MKICSKCFRTFDWQEDEHHNQVADIGDIFLSQNKVADDIAICPECREKIGMLKLMGFGQ